MTKLPTCLPTFSWSRIARDKSRLLTLTFIYISVKKKAGKSFRSEYPSFIISTHSSLPRSKTKLFVACLIWSFDFPKNGFTTLQSFLSRNNFLWSSVKLAYNIRRPVNQESIAAGQREAYSYFPWRRQSCCSDYHCMKLDWKSLPSDVVKNRKRFGWFFSVILLCFLILPGFTRQALELNEIKSTFACTLELTKFVHRKISINIPRTLFWFNQTAEFAF